MKLSLALASVLAVSSVLACSTGADGAGKSEGAATSDIDHMFRKADGTFDVWCVDGTTKTGVTAAEINSNQLCGGGPAPATSSSSSSSSSSGGAPSASSSSSSSGSTPNASSSSSSSSSGSAEPVSQCLAPTVPATATWKKPAAAAKVCTAADLKVLADTASTGANFAAMQAAVAAANAACASCIFTDESAPAWGPVVTSNNGTKGFVNWAACFARAPGGSDACGETFHHQYQCGLDMCSTCGDNAALVECYGQASSDAAKCGQYDVGAACGDFGALNTACNDQFDVIRSNCGG